MENTKISIGKNLCVRIKRYQHIVYENGEIGVILYFNRVTLWKGNGRGRFFSSVNNITLTDWDKIANEKIGVGSIINISIKYTVPYVVYEYYNGENPPGVEVIQKPVICPLCGKPIDNEEKTGKKIKCTNEACNRFEIIRITRFIKFCLGIYRFSYVSAYFLYTQLVVTSIRSLYSYLLPENLAAAYGPKTPLLQELVTALLAKTSIPRALIYYALLPKLTPNLIWRYSSTEIMSWTNVPNFPYSYNGVTLRNDRMESIEKCAESLLEYKRTHKDEIALLTTKVVVTHDVNPEIVDKMFYLMPYKNVPKEYIVDRIRLYGGRVERNYRNIYSKEGLKGLDIIVTDRPAELERLFEKGVITIRSYEWLQKQIELHIESV